MNFSGLGRALALGAFLAFPLSLAAMAVEFGDDTSHFSKDGQCDDPRFAGAGASAEMLADDAGHDATDCRAAFEAGSIDLAPEPGTATTETPALEEPERPVTIVPDQPIEPAAAQSTEIDFGDDSSSYANDGECDDPRFAGTGASSTMLEQDAMHDASDCRTAFDDGRVALAGSAPDARDLPPPISGAPDFGDNRSTYANDGECDDPRFAGDGAATTLLEEDRMHDAADCQAAFETGKVTLAETNAAAPDTAPVTAPSADGLEFGDDSSEYANDGECDDPRFEGAGSATTLLPEDQMHDATDCLAAYQAGSIALHLPTERETDKLDNRASAVVATDSSGIAFGDDTSPWANNVMCDDPRFTGRGVDSQVLPADEGHDASDCKIEFEKGTATLATIDANGLITGDDLGQYPNDGECDDPRLSGPGMASQLSDEGKFHDSTDCRAAYQRGAVLLPRVDASQVDFGYDGGPSANDGVCDDPRFEGWGEAAAADAAGALHDASDCQNAYEQSAIDLKPEPASTAVEENGTIDYGDDSSHFANDNECDDPRFVGEGAAAVMSDGDIRHDATDCSSLFEASKIKLK